MSGHVDLEMLASSIPSNPCDDESAQKPPHSAKSSTHEAEDGHESIMPIPDEMV